MARGVKKVYMIVTNDEYETPIMCDVVGKEVAAGFLGISISQLYRRIKNDKWIGEYKAIDMGYTDEQDDFEQEYCITEISKEERDENTKKIRKYKHEKRMEGELRKRKEYEATHREELREKSRAYYWSHREERCEYGKRRRRMMREKRKRLKMICNG